MFNQFFKRIGGLAHPDPRFDSKSLQAFLSLSGKEIRRILRIWAQTLLPPVLQTQLYLLIFGSVLGQKIGLMEGLTYPRFIIPGLLLSAAINNACSNVAHSFFSARLHNTLEAIVLAPVPNWAIIAGFAMGGIARALLICLLTGVILCASLLPIYAPFTLLALLCLTSLFFSLIGLLTAQWAKSFDGLSIVYTFVLTPLMYLSGSFYSAHILSPFFALCMRFNPLAYLVSTARYACLGIEGGSVLGTLACLSIGSIGCFIISVRKLQDYASLHL